MTCVKFILAIWVLLSSTVSHGKDCQLLATLTQYTAVLSEQYSNVVLPQEIYSVRSMPIAHNTTLQFTITRRGRVWTDIHPGNSDSVGTFSIHIPVRVVNTRVDWFEKKLGFVFRHHEDISDSELTLICDIKFELKNNILHTSLNNGFRWEKKPSINVAGIEIRIGTLAGGHVQRALDETNKSWQYAIQPALQNFIDGNCEWKEALDYTYGMLKNYKLSATEHTYLQAKVREWMDLKL